MTKLELLKALEGVGNDELVYVYHDEFDTLTPISGVWNIEAGRHPEDGSCTSNALGWSRGHVCETKDKVKLWVIT